MHKTAVLLAALTAFTLGHAQELQLPHIARTPSAPDYSHWCPELLAKGQPAKVTSPQELDIRSCDVSAWDFSRYTLQELTDVLTFDSKTKFPSKEKMPKGFDAKKLLDFGKNPGLSVRNLHARGITGKGVSVAIIDQPLLVTHAEYQKNLVWYEEDPSLAGTEAQMHGPAVASILAGKTVGAAPGVRLFYFVKAFQKDGEDFSAAPYTKMLHRVYEINKQLPAGEKIRAVSISRGGFGTDIPGGVEFMELKNKLEQDGVLVLTTDSPVHTLSRTRFLDKPDNEKNYCRPAYWDKSYQFYSQDDSLLVPTDYRVTAAPNGNGDYVAYANGGMSWGIPYAAGIYALAAQVYPQITPDIFMQAARETAFANSCTYNGEKFKTKYLIRPEKLIQKLQDMK